MELLRVTIDWAGFWGQDFLAFRSPAGNLILIPRSLTDFRETPPGMEWSDFEKATYELSIKLKGKKDA